MWLNMWRGTNKFCEGFRHRMKVYLIHLLEVFFVRWDSKDEATGSGYFGILKHDL